MTATGINDLLCYGDNKDVVTNLLACYEKWKKQPADLVRDLRGATIDDRCWAIFEYLTSHVVYKLDAPGCQYIKSPARLLKDGNGDCKSLTMFLACCLHCAGIKHIIRFVNFDGGAQYTHVYCVALDERGQEIILDMCELDDDGYILYNYARPFAKKQDYRYE